MTIAAAYPGVGSLAHRATIRHPDRIAFRHGAESTTYRQLGALIRSGILWETPQERAPSDWPGVVVL